MAFDSERILEEIVRQSARQQRIFWRDVTWRLSSSEFMALGYYQHTWCENQLATRKSEKQFAEVKMERVPKVDSILN